MIGNLLRAALLSLPSCGRRRHRRYGQRADPRPRGRQVYASPEATPLDDAVIVTISGVITADRQPSDVQIPPDARVIDCTGQDRRRRLLEQPRPFHAKPCGRTPASAPAAPLTAHMQEMLTRWGFTTVWDLGSDPQRYRWRCAAASMRTKSSVPDIFLVGSIFPRDGRPAYLPAEMQLPEAATPERGGADGARTYMSFGLDGIKLFTGSYKGAGKPVVNMDAAIAKAAVDVAHAQGKPVFAHPQNTAGVEAVIAAGVDVMAHTVARQPGYPPEQLARFKQQGIALTPTLSLFAKLPVPPEIVARIVDNIVGQLKELLGKWRSRSCSAPTSATPRSTTPRSNTS